MNPHLHHALVFAGQAVRRPFRGLVAAGALATAGGAVHVFLASRALPSEDRSAVDPLIVLVGLFVLLGTIQLLSAMSEPTRGIGSGPARAMRALPLAPWRRAMAEALGALTVWTAMLALVLLPTLLVLDVVTFGGTLRRIVATFLSPGATYFSGLLVVAPWLIVARRRAQGEPLQADLSGPWSRLVQWTPSIAPRPGNEPWHTRTGHLALLGLKRQAFGLAWVGAMALVLLGLYAVLGGYTPAALYARLEAGGYHLGAPAYLIALLCMTRAQAPLLCDVRTTHSGQNPFDGSIRTAWSVLPVRPTEVRRAAIVQAGLGLLVLWSLAGLAILPWGQDLLGFGLTSVLATTALLTVLTVLPVAAAYGGERLRFAAGVLLVATPVLWGMGMLLAETFAGTTGEVLALLMVVAPVGGAAWLVRHLLHPLPDEVAG